jgi:hypothetical protein
VASSIAVKVTLKEDLAILNEKQTIRARTFGLIYDLIHKRLIVGKRIERAKTEKNQGRGLESFFHAGEV